MNKCPHTSALIFPLPHENIWNVILLTTVFMQRMTHSLMLIISAELCSGGRWSRKHTLRNRYMLMQKKNHREMETREDSELWSTVLERKTAECKLQLNRRTGRVLPASAEGHSLFSVARHLLLPSVEVAKVTFESWYLNLERYVSHSPI